MPVLDGDFEAFVTNLGKYNEGELVGEWVKLPTTEEEMKKVFERIGIGSKNEFGNTYEEWFITDYECPLHGVSQMLGEYENLDRLNYLAALIDELSKDEQEKLVAIMDGGCDEVSNIDDLINLTFNLDTYEFIPSVHDDEDLGYYYLHDAGIYSEQDLGPFANYIDYERYGRDVRFEEGGSFTDEGYVRSTGDSWDIQFDGSREDIPDEYRIIGSGDAEARSSAISVLVVEPGKAPYMKEIDSGLESMQHEVGGNIEAVYPFEDLVAIVCNEEAKLEGLPLNRALRDEEGEIYDILAGTFLVTGLSSDNFASISSELQQKFAEHFKHPEMFVKMNGKIVAIPTEAEPEQSSKSTLDIFQLKDDDTGKKMSFMNYDYLKRFNMPITSEQYNKVYSGDMRDGESLESVYARFNLNHPADYRGHSLSVSDVIVVHENGKDSAYFVDSYGFKELPDFFQVKESLLDTLTQGLAVSGHIGTWHVIDEETVEDQAFFLLEHDTYGDAAAGLIVDSNGKLVLDEIYNGFDDETLEQIKLAQLVIINPPDPSITTDEMREYGYAWSGMLPMKADVAKEVISSCEIYRLFSNNIEDPVHDAKEIDAHAAYGGIFGVTKADWQAHTERENPLKAAEMSTEDDYGMIDGIINNGVKEPTDKAEKSSIMDRLKSAKAEPHQDKPQPQMERKSEHEL